jgi:hypothetical protein
MMHFPRIKLEAQEGILIVGPDFAAIRPSGVARRK